MLNNKVRILFGLIFLGSSITTAFAANFCSTVTFLYNTGLSPDIKCDLSTTDTNCEKKDKSITCNGGNYVYWKWYNIALTCTNNAGDKSFTIMHNYGYDKDWGKSCSNLWMDKEYFDFGTHYGPLPDTKKATVFLTADVPHTLVIDISNVNWNR